MRRDFPHQNNYRLRLFGQCCGGGVESLPELKKLLRMEALARRDALDPLTRVELSLHVAELGIRNIVVKRGTIVSGFLPIRSEIDLRPLLHMFADKEARICVPAILDRQTIVFREFVRGEPMVDTGFGTCGPGPDAAMLDPEIMLVPLAAFDSRGHRLGYGAGHYDRAIAKLHAKGLKPRLIGTAFSCQEVDRVPDEPHDVALSEILTEDGLRQFATAG
jgi:5-formyltetrahydrofolate cyclo-ligase